MHFPLPRPLYAGSVSNHRILRELQLQFVSLLSSSRLWDSDMALQHGDTTVLLHCLAVAYFSLKIAKTLRLRCDRNSLVRGALLHDYFLYDWHIPDKSHKLHGFHHPARALSNAKNDFELTRTEEDIIAHHMFPLTPIPPQSREAMLVCLVDKGCGIYETFGRHTYPALRNLIHQQKHSA